MYSYLCTRPNEKLFLDLAGPLPSSNGFKFILIAVDAFSRFVFLIPLRTATSASIIESLKTRIFGTFGLWQVICTDNGSIFSSKSFQIFLFTQGILKQNLIRYYPNPSLAERQIKNMKAAIIAYHADDQSKWSESIPLIQTALNSATVSSTGFTPSKIFLSREILTPLHLQWDDTNLTDTKHDYPTVELWRNVYGNLIVAHRKMQRSYDKTHKFVEYEIGDHVLIKTYVLSNKLKKIASKLSFKYSNPYEVVQRLSPVSYKLRSIANSDDIKLAHVSQQKKFIAPRVK